MIKVHVMAIIVGLLNSKPVIIKQKHLTSQRFDHHKITVAVRSKISQICVAFVAVAFALHCE